MNQIKTNISETDSTNEIVNGSSTTQLQHVFVLIQQLHSTISSGSTSGISSLLQTILAQLKSLQSVTSSSVNQFIVTITTKITQLQQQVQTGKIDISSITSFIQVIVANRILTVM